jgi:predicted GH43/DUF377 family glycosyl hydrolase
MTQTTPGNEAMLLIATHPPMKERIPMRARTVLIMAVIALLMIGTATQIRADQSWHRYPGNPVLHTSPSGWDSVHLAEPFVLKDETEYKMYYTAWGASGTFIGMATSIDGLVWSKRPDNPTFPASASGWDRTDTQAPSVLKEGDVYKMWYTGGDGSTNAIGYATSSDGIEWTKYPQAVLQSTPGSWDRSGMTASSVITDATGYKMYYMGNDGSAWHIGLATSDDGIVWTKYAGNPLISPRSWAWDSGEVGHPAVLLIDGVYHMWYGNTYSIGYASSADGLAWTRENSPVLGQLSPNESCRVVDATVLVLEGNLHMWYVSGCNMDGISYATTGEVPTPIPTGTAIPTRTRTPTATATPTFDPATRPNRVYFPVIIKDVPPPTSTPTPTRTPTRTATATPLPQGMFPFFSEGFEGAWPGPWAVYDGDGGNSGEYKWAKRSCLPFQGQNSAWAVGGGADGQGLGCGSLYPNGADSWMIYGPFSLANMSAAEMRFWLWLNTQTNVDGVCRTASVDGANFYGTCTSGNTQGWIERVTDFRNVQGLGNLIGSPNVWIGIAFLSNEATTYPQGAYVDNVILNKCVSNCPSAGSLAAAESDDIVEYPVMVTLSK